MAAKKQMEMMKSSANGAGDAIGARDQGPSCEALKVVTPELEQPKPEEPAVSLGDYYDAATHDQLVKSLVRFSQLVGGLAADMNDNQPKHNVSQAESFDKPRRFEEQRPSNSCLYESLKRSGILLDALKRSRMLFDDLTAHTEAARWSREGLERLAKEMDILCSAIVKVCIQILPSATDDTLRLQQTNGNTTGTGYAAGLPVQWLGAGVAASCCAGWFGGCCCAGGVIAGVCRLAAVRPQLYVMDSSLAATLKAKLPHMNQKTCEHIVEMSQHLASIGVGEGQRAHGFTFVCGEAPKLLEVYTEEEDGQSFECGVVGRSMLGDRHLFQGKSVCVADWKKHFQLIASAVQQNGAIVVDCKTGNFVSMRYMVSDISWGDSGGGARHQSASAIAINETAGRCFVVKASRNITTNGSGNLDVFPGQRKPIAVPVCDEEPLPLQSAVAELRKLYNIMNLNAAKQEVARRHTH